MNPFRHSPLRRGRSERNFGTWQGRLPQELRIRNIRTVEEANHFLRSHYIAEFNRKFTDHDIGDATKGFDARYGTKLYEAMLKNGFPGR